MISSLFLDPFVCHNTNCHLILSIKKIAYHATLEKKRQIAMAVMKILVFFI